MIRIDVNEEGSFIFETTERWRVFLEALLWESIGRVDRARCLSKSAEGKWIIQEPAKEGKISLAERINLLPLKLVEAQIFMSEAADREREERLDSVDPDVLLRRKVHRTSQVLFGVA